MSKIINKNSNKISPVLEPSENLGGSLDENKTKAADERRRRRRTVHLGASTGSSRKPKKKLAKSLELPIPADKQKSYLKQPSTSEQFSKSKSEESYDYHDLVESDTEIKAFKKKSNVKIDEPLTDPDKKKKKKKRKRSKTEPSSSTTTKTKTKQPQGIGNAAKLDSFHQKANVWEISPSELTIGEQIGKGAFGTVYIGTWRNGEVVIKQASDSVTFSASDLHEFRKEARVMMLLRPHPNVVQFIGLCSQEKYPLSLVTELVAKGDCKNYIRSAEPISLQRLVNFAATAAAGVAHLHAEGYVHGDIAARNLLINENWSAKVADFGMTKLMDATATAASLKSLVGPLKWMSPESLESKEFSQESDVWSFGVTIYELLSRADPYPDETPMNAALGVLSGTMSLKLPSHYPKSLQNIISASCGKNPKLRPTMRDISAGLFDVHDNFEIKSFGYVDNPTLTANKVVQTEFEQDEDIYE